MRVLVLGAGGRVGRLLRGVAAAGLWPGVVPIWHLRQAAGADTVAWDLLDEAPPPDPRLGDIAGVIALAGVTAGDAAALAANSALALAAARLARPGVPVLVMSSAAVYGRAAGPLDEGRAPTPANAYGAAKAAMEAALAGRPGVTCIRLGNVGGADQLFAAMAAGAVTLDLFPDGHGPRRSFIGPVTLARALCALLAAGPLPPVLNLAEQGTLPMDAILTAAGARWSGRPAPATALPDVALDVTAAAARVPLPRADAARLVAESVAAGWRVAP